MTYHRLLKLLQSEDVYNDLKKYEEDLFKLIPELNACKGFEQNSDWHIYDVYEHILHVVSKTNNNKYLRLAALFHDIGKPLTYTEDNNGVGHFYNHWNISLKIFCEYQNKFELSKEEIRLIKYLIYYHDINLDNLSNDEINEMVENINIKNLGLLFDLKKADLLSQSKKYHYLLANIEKTKK